MRRPWIAATLGGSLVIFGAAADEPQSTGPAVGSAAAPAPPLTPEAEVRALTLVRDHLPELAVVLDPLKGKNPAEYRKAMTDLAAESRNLADLRARSPARADLALEAWQARTRVELVAAQLAAARTPERESQLRAVIEARVDVDVRRQRFEFEQAEAAVAKVRENLARAEKNRDRAKEALDRAEKNRSAKVENRYRALNPATKPSPAARARPKAAPTPVPVPAASGGFGLAPTPNPATGAVPMPAPPDLPSNVAPLPAPDLATQVVPMPSSPVEGQPR